MDRNIKCVVSYDGSHYNGFQIQLNAPSIQQELNLALFKICKKEINIVGSGRTDKGVHATNQVFNFHSDINMSEEQWKKAINANLPEDIYIKEVSFVNDGFHARFNAKGKIYSYYLNVGEYDPLKKDYIYQYNYPLDIKKMEKASKLFIGEHDFRNFCSNNESEVKDFIKTIYSIEIKKENDIICFTFHGSGFMRYMVRMLVGTLIEIGSSRKGEELITDRLDKKDALTISYNAPANGLYLEKVEY